MNHEVFMQAALEQAKLAFENQEVPVGAVVVKDDVIISVAHNLRETHSRPSAHAEIVAMDRAGLKLKTWNLSGCTLYVTVEPCQMCAGAMMQNHIDTVVYGAPEPNSGSFGTVFNLTDIKGFNHYPKIIKGILEEGSRTLMQDFFKLRREEAIKIKRISEEYFNEYLNVRKLVFVEEQGVNIDIEYDAYDDLKRSDTVHVGAFYKGHVVGTARYVMKADTLKIGRLAVLKSHRKFKIGSKLLNYIEIQAKNNGFRTLELGAQVNAIPFYERNGYTPYGEVFLDADIDHIMMNKKI